MAPFNETPDAATMRIYSLYGEMVSDRSDGTQRKKSAIDTQVSKFSAQAEPAPEPLQTDWRSPIRHQLWINAAADYIWLTGPQAGLPSDIDSKVFANLGWCRPGPPFKLLTKELFLRVQSQLDAAPAKTMDQAERQRWGDWYDVILEFAALEGWLEG